MCIPTRNIYDAVDFYCDIISEYHSTCYRIYISFNRSCVHYLLYRIYTFYNTLELYMWTPFDCSVRKLFLYEAATFTPSHKINNYNICAVLLQLSVDQRARARAVYACEIINDNPCYNKYHGLCVCMLVDTYIFCRHVFFDNHHRQQ